MAILIRKLSANDPVIKKLQKITNVNTASVAITKAVDNYLLLLEQHKKLQAELQALKTTHETITEEVAQLISLRSQEQVLHKVLKQQLKLK